ncbi:MAG: hypothetical protein R3D58_23470 [Saprospiraceae bacterium]
MENSPVFTLIHSFTPVELRDVRKFLQSPFFNQRQDIIDLFEALAANQTPEKTALWSQLYPGTAFDDQKLRLLMSYLHRLLEQYLTTKEAAAEPLDHQLRLVVAYRKRGMANAFERAYKTLERRLEAQTLRNVNYHDNRYLLKWEAHQLANTLNPNDVSRLLELSEEVEVIYLAQKLRLICLLAAHGAVYQSDFQIDRQVEVLARAEQKQFAEVPAIALNLHCYRMLCNPDEEVHFLRFKTLLFEQAGRFYDEEMHGFYILAINYCVRQINAGVSRFYREALELYKEALSKAYLLENGVLSRFTYHNVVAAGLQTGELDWVRYFINEYKNQLEKRYRESSFSFNLARLEYAQRNYGFVLELLQKANYRDPLLNLAAKTLLLKTYYDLGEHELLQSHLDAMRNYVHRKRVLGYHRSNYLNIIRYTEKLTQLHRSDRKAIAALKNAVEQETVLTEKAFFQNVLHVMQ